VAVLGLEMRRVSSPRSLFVVSGVVAGPCDGGSGGGRVLTCRMVVVALAIVHTHMLLIGSNHTQYLKRFKRKSAST
jgi:hypothetical protein